MKKRNKILLILAVIAVVACGVAGCSWAGFNSSLNTLSGSIITFTTPLVSSDKIAVINGVTSAIDLTNYKQKAEEIIINDTAITISNILANKNYVFNSNAITSITLTACETSYEETTIEFSTGATAPTLTDNTGIVWVDGSAPTLNANKSYLIVIFNNLGFVKEY